MWRRYPVALLVMVPLCAILGLLAAAALAYLLPKKYGSTTMIEIRPSLAVTGAAGPPGSGYFASQREVIKSRRIMDDVIGRLDLTGRWRMDRENVIKVLKRIVATKSIKGTDLVSIEVRHTNPTDARDIAREVAAFYSEFMRGMETDMMTRKLQVMRKAVVDQGDKVEERTKILATVRRAKVVESEEKTRPLRWGDGPDIDDLKRELEEDRKILDQLNLNLKAEEISSKIPREPVLVHEEAQLPKAPVSPNVTLYLVLGTAAGLLFSPIFAIPLAWMPGRTETAASPPKLA